MTFPKIAFSGAALPQTHQKIWRVPARACAQHEGATDRVLYQALRKRRVALYGVGAVAAEEMAMAARCATATWAYRIQDVSPEARFHAFRGVGHRDITGDEEELAWEHVARDGNENEERCSAEDRALVVNAVSAFTACWLFGIAFALSI